MKLATDENEAIVSLGKRQKKDADAAATFGVSISRSGHADIAANGGSESPFARLVFDETQAYYIASLEGALIGVSDQYHVLSAQLGDGQLAPGSPDLIGKGNVGALKLVVDDVLAANGTVRAREKARVGNTDLTFLGRHLPVRDDHGEIIAVAGVYEDVTAQVRGVEDAARAQSRFQDFARASSDWFWECDTEMKITELSDRFTAMVGRPASLYKGSRFEQIGELRENLAGRNELATAVEARKPFRDQLVEVSGEKNEILKIHLSGVPVFDRKSGTHVGYRGVGTDVTRRYADAEQAIAHRNELEKMLRELTRKNIALDEATEKATTALKAKNEFLAAMSHELRTPLNAIIGFASAIEGQSFGELSDDYAQYGSDIHVAGKHLLSLINDILDLSVIESGGLTLHIEDIPLEIIVNQAANMNMARAQEKNIDTSEWKIEDIHDVMADDRRATQIVVNLLSNAVKFTPEGGAIGIDVEDRPKEIAVTVWDTGIGIAEENLDKVFEKFQQITDDFYSRQQEGTGLGLHISRELARYMDGELTATSVPGEGSRFTLTLPKA